MEREVGRPNSDEEKRQLQQLGKEADQWVDQALLLLVEVKADDMKKREEEKEGSQRQPSPAKVDVSLHPSCLHLTYLPQTPASVTEELGEGGLPLEMFVMGEDLNIHPKLLQQIIDEVRPLSLKSTSSKLGNCVSPPSRPLALSLQHSLNWDCVQNKVRSLSDVVPLGQKVSRLV